MTSFAGIVTRDELTELSEYLLPLGPSALIEHNKSSLLAHLVGVWRVLCAGGVSNEIAVAGLIHSVYSTQYFKVALFSEGDRSKLAQVYGERAEHIAWLFCQIDRSSLWASRPQNGFVDNVAALKYASMGSVQIDAEMANTLFLLECANFIDQGYPGRSVGPFHAWALSLVDRGVNLRFTHNKEIFPTEEDELTAIDCYLAQVEATNFAKNLKLAASHAPLAAEPLILIASFLAAEGRFEEADNFLLRARNRLPIFGTSWDKRLSFPEWTEVVNALSLSIESREFQPKGDPTNPLFLRDWLMTGGNGVNIDSQ